MSLTLAELNDAQARHAIQLLFDLLPDSAWQDGKPTVERVNTVVRALGEQTSPADAGTLSSLSDGRNAAAQAALARVILEGALANPAWAAAAQSAIDGAAKANMMFDPVTGLLIIGLLLATTKVDRTPDGGLHVSFGANAAGVIAALRVPELLDKLPAVISALPQAIIAKLL